MLLRALEHVYIYDIEVPGTCLQLCCLRSLEHVYNYLDVARGTCLQLCCLRALEHVYIYGVVGPGTVHNYVVACPRTRFKSLI